jgi:hypothetical protein
MSKIKESELLSTAFGSRNSAFSQTGVTLFDVSSCIN